MIQQIEDPFDYQKPEWLKKKESEARRERRDKRLGRKSGTWGGYRPGAGRPRIRPWTHSVNLVLTNLQVKVLEEMGEGNLAIGIEKLIQENM